MARIPAPKRTDGDCISIGGITICPHVVHLTASQVDRVKKMHESNVARVQKSIAKAKTAKSKGIA
jgi:hypothetical protein